MLGEAHSVITVCCVGKYIYSDGGAVMLVEHITGEGRGDRR
jgi:hypothetical protein